MRNIQVIRSAVLAVAGGLCLASPAWAAQACLAYDDPATQLRGTVYAMEGFDEDKVDTVSRERQVDFYALVMTDRICLEGVAGDPTRPTAFHMTVVRLDMPVEMAKMVVGRPVLVQGALGPNGGPEADPPLVIKVGGLAAQ